MFEFGENLNHTHDWNCCFNQLAKNLIDYSQLELNYFQDWGANYEIAWDSNVHAPVFLQTYPVLTCSWFGLSRS